jgi:hypothetical protein
MRHKCFGFAEFMLAFGGGAYDEVGGHLWLLVSISLVFLSYSISLCGMGKGKEWMGRCVASGARLMRGRVYEIVVAEENSQCHNERGYTWQLSRKRGRASDVTKN